MHEQPQIVSTKKLLPNQRQFLLNAGMSVIEADFIKIQYCDIEIPIAADFLIFTSSNAVKSILLNKKIEKLQQIPCFCVGEKTAQLLIQNGFQVHNSADYADDLIGSITAETGKKFIFLCGNLRLNTIPNALRDANIQFQEFEVYKTALHPMKISGSPTGILFFSPSAIKSYLQLNKIGDAVCFCIGNTTANALQHITPNIVIAQKPTVENVIIRAIKHFNELRQTDTTKQI